MPSMANVWSKLSQPFAESGRLAATHEFVSPLPISGAAFANGMLTLVALRGVRPKANVTHVTEWQVAIASQKSGRVVGRPGCCLTRALPRMENPTRMARLEGNRIAWFLSGFL